MLRCLGFELFC